MNIFKEMLASSAAATTNIEFVGGSAVGYAGSTFEINVNITSLTGGLDTSPSEGDVVVAFISVGEYSYLVTGTANLPAGWTDITGEVSELDSHGCKFRAFYKIMGITPDTSFTIPGGTGNNNDAGAAGILCFRGAHQTTPIYSYSTATGTDSSLPHPPSIIAAPTGSVLAISGANGMDSVQKITYLPDLDTGYIAHGGDAGDTDLGVGTKEWTGSFYAPATFGGSTSTADCWCAASIVIQPQ